MDAQLDNLMENAMSYGMTAAHATEAVADIQFYICCTICSKSEQGFKHWVMLLMFTEIRVTDSMPPCGTPISCGWELENVLPTRTFISFKQMETKLGKRHLRPNLSRRSREKEIDYKGLDLWK